MNALLTCPTYALLAFLESKENITSNAHLPGVLQADFLRTSTTFRLPFLRSKREMPSTLHQILHAFSNQPPSHIKKRECVLSLPFRIRLFAYSSHQDRSHRSLAPVVVDTSSSTVLNSDLVSFSLPSPFSSVATCCVNAGLRSL
jgi:hypothetical protein